VTEIGSVEVTLVGVLRHYVGGQEQVFVEAAQSIHDVILALGMRPWLVSVVMVNGVRSEKSYILQPGDRLKLLPLISGG
jgi:sulfur carrier protein ThiS